MKYSGIGGQAVLEGIMMKNQDKYAVAVRKPDGDIALEIKQETPWAVKHPWMGLPFIRGTFNFIESLKIGVGTLMYSASFYEEDEPKAGEDAAKAGGEAKAESAEQTADASASADTKKSSTKEDLAMVGTLMFSLAFAIALFSLLPTFIASLLNLGDDHYLLRALLEGIIRIAIFVGYVWAVSFMKDIKRTYMYHGSEHKCINCIEHGLPLTVENVRASSKEHKRCGTSFMLIVMIISVFVFMFVRVDNIFLRLLSRILLLPVVAGLSYEFLRLAGRSESKIINALSRPGMWLQGLTTKEPTDDMIEVAIKAVEAVFDWKEFEANMDEDDRKGCCG